MLWAWPGLDAPITTLALSGETIEDIVPAFPRTDDSRSVQRSFVAFGSDGQGGMPELLASRRYSRSAAPSVQHLLRTLWGPPLRSCGPLPRTVMPCYFELPVGRCLNSVVRAPSPARTRRFDSCQVQLETRSAIFAVVAAFCSRSSLCDTHSARSGSFGPIESPSSFLKLRQKRIYAVVHTAKLSSRE